MHSKINRTKCIYVINKKNPRTSTVHWRMQLFLSTTDIRSITHTRASRDKTTAGENNKTNNNNVAPHLGQASHPSPWIRSIRGAQLRGCYLLRSSSRDPAQSLGRPQQSSPIVHLVSRIGEAVASLWTGCNDPLREITLHRRASISYIDVDRSRLCVRVKWCRNGSWNMHWCREEQSQGARLACP